MRKFLLCVSVSAFASAARARLTLANRGNVCHDNLNGVIRSDRELIAAWQRGDLHAGAELFERYYESIARFFRNKLDGPAQDDLVQQVFLRCTESVDRFRGASSFRTFIFAIARNTLKEYFRNQARRDKREAYGIDLDINSMIDLGESPTLPESVVVQREELRLLLEGLRRLPLNYQTALELHYWETLTAAEISEIMRIPLGTVKTRIRDGRRLLEKELFGLSKNLLQSTLDNLSAWAERVRPQGL